MLIFIIAEIEHERLLCIRTHDIVKAGPDGASIPLILYEYLLYHKITLQYYNMQNTHTIVGITLI